MEKQPDLVLIVEDDPSLRLTLDLILNEAGYRTLLAENGQKALDELSRLELGNGAFPSAILLDMKMPVMDGWAFSRAFREKYDHLIPMIVNTAAESAQQRASEVAADACVGKPFDIEELLGVLARFATPRDIAA